MTGFLTHPAVGYVGGWLGAFVLGYAAAHGMKWWQWRRAERRLQLPRAKARRR